MLADCCFSPGYCVAASLSRCAFSTVDGFYVNGLGEALAWQTLESQQHRASELFPYLRWPMSMPGWWGCKAFAKLAGSAGFSGGCCPIRSAVMARKFVSVCRWMSVLSLSVCLAGCIAPGSPVVTRSNSGQFNQTTYTVVRGDTLYSIAWRFDFDYRRLAAANKTVRRIRFIPAKYWG